MSNTQAKLDQAIKDRLIANDAFNEEILKLKAKLKDEQKPKDELGDVRMYSGSAYDFMVYGGDGKWRNKYGSVFSRDRIKGNLAFNLIDDLKAMATDLTTESFLDEPYNGMEVELVGRDVHLRKQDRCIVVRDISKLRKLLRRAEATLKRRQ